MNYWYDLDIVGTVSRVYDDWPKFMVDIDEDDGKRHTFELNELPGPENKDGEEFWTGLVGKRVRLLDTRVVTVEILQ